MYIYYTVTIVDMYVHSILCIHTSTCTLAPTILCHTGGNSTIINV